MSKTSNMGQFEENYWDRIIEIKARNPDVDNQDLKKEVNR